MKKIAGIAIIVLIFVSLFIAYSVATGKPLMVLACFGCGFAIAWLIILAINWIVEE